MVYYLKFYTNNFIANCVDSIFIVPWITLKNTEVLLIAIT